jgi:hypothetical protein
VRIPRDPRVGRDALKHRWAARRSRLYGHGGQSRHLIADCLIADCRGFPFFVCKRMVAANIEAEADLLLLIAAVSKAGRMHHPDRPSTFTRLLPFPGHNGFASDHDGNAHKRPKNPASSIATLALSNTSSAEL